MPADETIWHREVITADAEQVLVEMQRRSVLAGFYLAGGTGLALRFGHSRSHDLGFFSPEPVRENILIDKVARSGHFSVEAKAPGTLHATVQGIKVSFFEYAYPLLLPPEPFSGVPVAAALDISCMKLSAAASRGTKRDFIDLEFCDR